MEFDYDVAVIGAGSAGMSAYRMAKREGKKACLIENREYGTKCASYGCMPSKLLIAAAENAHNIQKASQFGIDVENVKVNRSAVMRRVRKERERFVNYVKDDISSFPKDEIKLGTYHFIDDNTLYNEHYEKKLTARTFVIATGTNPYILPILKPLLETDLVFDTRRFFDYHLLPKSIAIVGSGVIGLEIGQALTRLGVKTVIIGVRNNISGLKDPIVLERANHIFKEELKIYNDAEITGVEVVQEEFDDWYKDKEVAVSWSENGQHYYDRFECILAATGTRPNVNGLELQNTSLQLQNGIPVIDRNSLECLRDDEHASNIFIAGDITQDREILHEAILEGQHAGLNASKYLKVVDRKIRTSFSVTFTDPQVMMVGKTYADLKEGEYAIGAVDYTNQGRSRIMLKNKGLLHMYFSAYGSRMLLGAEMCGPDAEYFGAWFATFINRAMTVDDILEEPFYHPTIFESVRTACRDAKKSLDILEKI